MPAVRTRPFASIRLFTALLCGLFAVQGAAAATLYVIPGGAGSGACGSWATACTLPYALSSATSGDELWVAAGVYVPTTSIVTSPSTTDQAKSFAIPPGVAVYGGFAGTETSRDQRDPDTNVTVLSGDIDGNDANTDGNSIDESFLDQQGSNSYNVVTMDGTGTPITTTTVLDGFTITGGSAGSGAGLSCNGAGSGSECSPKLSHLVFSGNIASNGGALYNDGESGGTSSPTLTDVTFSGNAATRSGGAVYNQGNAGTSSPTFTDVTFSGNTALTSGSAIFNNGNSAGAGHLALTNVTFSGNTRTMAMINFCFNNSTCSVTLTNVTFNQNQAGAIVNNGDGTGTFTVTLTNVILWNDNGEMGNGSVNPTIDHSVIAACPSGASCTNLVTTDPLLGPLQNNGGPTETMALGAGSSAIDAGDDGACPATDQRGTIRPQGAHCDIGAYELDATVPSVTVDQASGQADPAGASPVHFTATFSEPIDTSTFTGSDVTLGGSAPGTLVATVTQVAPNDGTTFDIAVSGMTGSGTVTAGLAAGVVMDSGYNGNTQSTSTDDSVTYSVLPQVAATSLQSYYPTTGPASFTVTFNEPVSNASATNPDNYLLVEAGSNGRFDTLSCAGGVVSDDTQVPLTGVSYDGGTLSTTVTLGAPLPIGRYRLFVCGTTSITDLIGNPLNGGTDATVNFNVGIQDVVPTLGFPGLALLGLLLAAGALWLLHRS